MKKVLAVFGTRPEAIKMAPLVKELQKSEFLQVMVCVTGQHKEMLSQVLDVFKIIPDFDLEIMKENQSLFDVTSRILDKMDILLEKEKPDIVLVHGDTSTTFATALSCFYKQIPVGHVEAGLRTFDMSSPFPEEFNRQAVGLVTKYHFAPTKKSKENLLREEKNESDIFITGNTAIDALKTTVQKNYDHPILDWAGNSRLILITAHRRENLGKPMESMFRAIKRVIDETPDVKAVYPVHLNPKVQSVAKQVFGDDDRIKLIKPLEVIDFHNIMAKSHLILTDSGGIQEEAPGLGIPVLVMRDTTERPEGIEAGTLKLVGHDEELIYSTCNELLNNKETYLQMSKASNPYGDGTASIQIRQILEENLN